MDNSDGSNLCLVLRFYCNDSSLLGQHCSLIQSNVVCLPLEMYFPEAYMLVGLPITSSYIPSFINPALATPFAQSPPPFRALAPHILALFFHRSYFILFTHCIFIWQARARSWFPSNFFKDISFGWAFPWSLLFPSPSLYCLLEPFTLSSFPINPSTFNIPSPTLILPKLYYLSSLKAHPVTNGLCLVSKLSM